MQGQDRDVNDNGVKRPAAQAGDVQARHAHAQVRHLGFRPRALLEKTGYTVHSGCDHVFFIGFLGVGKSTLARNLGEMFNRRHFDTDRMVVHTERMSVAQIFATLGEERFRELEEHVLRSLVAEKSCLVSCGGGIVERQTSVDLMHQMGKVVFLDGDLDEALSHISHPEIRPDFLTYEEAESLLAHRQPLYKAAADIVVDTRGLTFTQMAYVVGERLYDEGLL